MKKSSLNALPGLVRWALVFSPVVVSSCSSVGPDYQGPPEVALPKAWNHNLAKSSRSVHNLSQWWSVLNDPQLTALIEQSRRSNLDVRIALARITEAEAQAGAAASQRYPSVNITGKFARIGTSENLLSVPARTTNFENIGTSAGWEIDLFGRIRRQNQAAQASADASVESYRDIMVSLSAEIARTYVEVRTLQKRLQLARKNVSNQRETVKLVAARYRAELTSQLDVTQAEQSLANSESVIPVLDAALQHAFNRLAVLSGRPPGALNQQLAGVKPIPSITGRTVSSIPRDLLRQRPDIRKAERQLAAQTAKIGVATADLYPRLSLGGSFGFSTSTGNLFNAASNNWSFGPSLTWNVFNAGQTRNLIKAENSRAEQARANYEKTVLQAFEDVEKNLINYSYEITRLKALARSVDSAKKTVSIANSQYKNGLTNFNTVLDAERVLFAEEDRLADSQGALVRHLIGIYRSVGGGWK